MKNLILIIVFMLIISNVNSQSNPVIVEYYKWSNPIIFNISGPPKIQGYGIQRIY